MFALCSNESPSHLDLRRLPETSRGRRRERLLRAVSQTALGRPPGTTTRMMSERPQWSAARRVPRSQGARGRLASVLRRASQARQGAARTRTERLFGAPLPLSRETERRRRPVRLKAAKGQTGAAKRWLFDKVKNDLP